MVNATQMKWGRHIIGKKPEECDLREWFSLIRKAKENGGPILVAFWQKGNGEGRKGDTIHRPLKKSCPPAPFLSIFPSPATVSQKIPPLPFEIKGGS